jgi:hypothetical protein
MTTITPEALQAIVQRTMLQALQRHATANYGTAVEVPQIARHGEYAKMTGYFGLVDVARDIAIAVEAALSESRS